MYSFPTLSDSSKNKIHTIVIVCSVVFGIGFWLYGARPFVVNGLSMFPSFNYDFAENKNHILSGDYIFIDIFSYTFLEEPKRFDVIVARSPIENKRFILKRIIGLPGDTIMLEKNIVKITSPSGKTMTIEEPYVYKKETIVYKNLISVLGPEEYFIMGDNRSNSLDSRSWGSLPKNKIVGKALGRVYPFKYAEFFPGSIDKLET